MSLLCNYDELYDSLIKTKPRSAKSFAFSLTLFLILCLWLFWDYFCRSRKAVCRSQVLVCVLMQSNCRIAGQLPFWKLWLCDEVLVIGKNIAKYPIDLKLFLDLFSFNNFLSWRFIWSGTRKCFFTILSVPGDFILSSTDKLVSLLAHGWHPSLSHCGRMQKSFLSKCKKRPRHLDTIDILFGVILSSETLNEIFTFYLPLHPVYFVRRRTELGGEMQILSVCQWRWW